MSVCVVYVCMCVYMCMCACTFIQGSMAWCRCSESLIAARLPCCFLVLSIVLGPPPLTDIFSKSEAKGFLQLRPFGDVSADVCVCVCVCLCMCVCVRVCVFESVRCFVCAFV